MSHDDGRGGHSVLVVPVPELEPVVRGRWEHYEPGWVSTDPAFTHAHVTALAPYLREPSADDLALVAEVAAGTPAFDYVLVDLDVFPGGTIHLRPEPAAPFADLTERLCTSFPQCPPYEGQYDVAPHLTLDHLAGEVTLASTRALLGDAVPARCRADRLELHWYEPGRCHRVAAWPLGGDGRSGRPVHDPGQARTVEER